MGYDVQRQPNSVMSESHNVLQFFYLPTQKNSAFYWGLNKLIQSGLILKRFFIYTLQSFMTASEGMI